MRLIRLQVEAFGPIHQAAVELGPGLNVLYGHNDLGKSYLAQAIRAALLLPHTSTAHQQFVRWGTDDTPRVVLVFQTGGGAYWRVSKAFGKTAGAAATLERSAGGDQWAMEAKGRGVDGRLRSLLEWGIPEPGGKGKRLPRGLPRSFLTHVLLAEQEEVGSVFDQSLGDDPDESGKQLLGQALQALAQDPLFKTVLERSQQKVDEAFLPSGKKRRGQRDPFTRTSVAIRQARAEHERCKQQREDTQRVQEQLQDVSHRRLEAQAALEDAEASLAALERAWRARRKLREVEAELSAAEAEVAKITTAETEAERLVRRCAESEHGLERAGEVLKQAEQAAEQARERLREAESDRQAHRRELEKEQLAKRLLELRSAEREARTRAEIAEQAEARLREIEELAAQAAKSEGALTRAEAELSDLVGQQEALEKDQRQLRGVGALLAWRRAVAELEEATEARDRAADLRKRAGERRREGETLSRELAGRRLPSAEDVRSLRALEQELEVARARHDAGLSVRLRLARAIDLEVSADGEPAATTGGATGEHLFEAERSMLLQLGGVAEIEVLASAPEARREIAALGQRWRHEAVPVLEAAGVSEVEALAEARLAAGEQRRQADERRAEAERLESQATDLGELASQVAAREQRVKAREVTLGDFDRSTLQAFAQAGEDADAALAAGQLANEQALRETNAGREEKKSWIERARSDLGHLQKRLEDQRQRHAELAEGLDRPWQTVLAEARGELRRIARQVDDIATRQEAIEKERGTLLTDVKAGVETAREQLAQARRAVAERTRERDAAKGALESKRGQLEVLRENAQAIDLPALRSAAEAARAEVEALAEGAAAVTEEQLEETRRVLRIQGAALAERSREADKLQGALEQVGGDVAVEREKAALEALLRAQERERELELDYGAWRLLVESLREAENEESTHLGRALIGPVSERFAELTGGRYGRLGLDPELRTTGIGAAGEEREVSALSLGLKEQLATIFRISVARHLNSMILLDDQLTHTDPQRLSWFRDVLRQSGEEIQIVVLTCRPLDYLFEDELAGREQLVWDTVSQRLRGIDLERIVRRAGAAP